MSYTGLPNFRLAGHGANGVYYGPYWVGGPGRTNNQWPIIADSYNPFYGNPQTIYGSCDFVGGALRRNNCNYQQGGFRPQGLQGGGCRCVNADQSDWGCFNDRGRACL